MLGEVGGGGKWGVGRFTYYVFHRLVNIKIFTNKTKPVGCADDSLVGFFSGLEISCESSA